MRRKTTTAMLLLTMLALLAVPVGASADYCSQYPTAVPPRQLPPVAAIGSGYYGVGGAGPFDGYGCVNGSAVADTRLVYPAADFVVVVLARASCNQGDAINSLTVRGLGANHTGLRMTCYVDARDGLGLPNYRAYVSGIIPISGSGKITATITLGSRTYTTESRTII